MKKLLIALCALLLAVPGPALAQCDFTAFCGELPVLTLQYDESAFALDTESYLSGSVGGHTWIGMLSNRAVTVEMAADLCPDLPPESAPEQLSAYLCAALAADQCQPLEIYVTPGFVSFVILSLNGPAGQSYRAAVLSQGYIVYFELYNLRGGVTEVELNTLKTLLDCAALPLSY